MNKLFLTGMGRSGTTLLDKLLSSHSEIELLSQPFPLIYVQAKKNFFKEKKSYKFYVLNDDSISREYPQSEIDNYLERYQTNINEIESLFQKMDNYSGQYTKRDKNVIDDSPVNNGFTGVLDKCLQFYSTDDNCNYLGMKETMCEEFIPYLCLKNYKCIIIIRDPRDVLASANYPKGVKHFGAKKPTLFILKSWRKSVEYVKLLKNNKNFHFLKYEDLVNEPYTELGKITDFLEIDSFKDGCFNYGIHDRDKNLWLANTSFDLAGSFISKESVGIYKNILNNDEVSYVEAICSHEMDWLQYTRESNNDAADIIRRFEDVGVSEHSGLPADFSSRSDNKMGELSRIESFKNFY
jgi:hypothetical protein